MIMMHAPWVLPALLVGAAWIAPPEGANGPPAAPPTPTSPWLRTSPPALKKASKPGPTPTPTAVPVPNGTPTPPEPATFLQRLLPEPGGTGTWEDPRTWETPTAPAGPYPQAVDSAVLSGREPVHLESDRAIQSLRLGPVFGPAHLEGPGRLRAGTLEFEPSPQPVTLLDECTLDVASDVTLEGAVAIRNGASLDVADHTVTIDRSALLTLDDGRVEAGRMEISSRVPIGLGALLRATNRAAAHQVVLRMNPDGAGLEGQLQLALQRLRRLRDLRAVPPVVAAQAEAAILALHNRPANEISTLLTWIDSALQRHAAGAGVSISGQAADGAAGGPGIASLLDDRAGVAGEGRIEADVENAGTLESSTGTADLSSLLAFGAPAALAMIPGPMTPGIVISGDYRQLPPGELRPAFTKRDAGNPTVYVKGAATFVRPGESDGSATVPPHPFQPSSAVSPQLQEGLVLTRGDRLSVLAASKIEGRPEPFSASWSPALPDAFLGLDCSREYGTPGVTTLDVMVLDIPRYADGALMTSRFPKPNLIVVTHGTMSSIAGSRPGDPPAPDTGFLAIASGMESLIRSCGREADWDVVTLDWREFAATVDAGETARVGHEIGMSLVDWMVDGLGYGRHLRTLHVMGHSSGSWVADGVADRVAARRDAWPDGRKPRVVLTLFDAFDWPGRARMPGLTPAVLFAHALGQLGDTADELEHYFDAAVPGTSNLNAGLPGRAIGVDVSRLRPVAPMQILEWAQQSAILAVLAAQSLPGIQVPAWLPIARPVLWWDSVAAARSTLQALFDRYGNWPGRHSWPWIWYLWTIRHALSDPAAQPCAGDASCEWRSWGAIRAPFFRERLLEMDPAEVAALGFTDALREVPRGSVVALPER